MSVVHDTAADQQQAKGQGSQPGRTMDVGRLLRFLAAGPVYFALFLFLPAGTLAWVEGWIFIVAFLASTSGIALWLWHVNPEVVVARVNLHEGTKRWDRMLLSFLFPILYAIVPVAALDACRFQWFPVPWWVCGIGYVLFFAGLAISTWAEAVNKFFEPTVRIQTDRGHRVIDTGPYAIIRHPGYLGGALVCAGTALCLGSLWALVPAGLGIILLVLRTCWEDQTLRAELAGYKDYAQRVRFKLIPGLW